MTERSTEGAALAGVRVLEIAHAAAAVTGRLLADLGADVIKIEPPGGEAARRLPPLATLPNGAEESCYWLAFNTGKRSVTIDLTTQDGRNRFVALARSADIVVTDFERVGINENDELAALARTANPDLIWTEIWPFGRGLPFERYPATDTILQALGGHLFLNGDIDRPPVRIGMPVGVMQGGAEAANAALMAYYHKLRGGPGQRVDISIQECIVWTLLNTTMSWQILALNEERGGAVRKERANKFYTRLVWPCSDGFIFFGPVGGGGGTAREKSFSALVDWMIASGFDAPILHAHDWNGPGQFNIPQSAYDAVTDHIGRFIETKTAAELMQKAVEQRILLAPVSSPRQIFEYPHFRERNFFARLYDGIRGIDVDYPALWAQMSLTPLQALRPAPAPGADTHTILETVLERGHSR
ncbi:MULTISPECIES: CoA transferase [unclassified Beijerinckia]|uniref:CoA transferase n=1 Tax=unclassified Beijerinckia TaxID=2638183 RepID=UPI00089A7CC7|nr:MULTISPECIES: CoA transferase [unclassified Beijerinckia]MDH7793944.1 crotonobetainyl-CoA:carnitine CoA-transferase CaiB-like acyl-CoA transferase [Beijerinckia sp. GAS462]SEB49950.1 benzylsuccinate CoA-transferase BbsE subunit [Beijerinckia sp. 28-YEA-48]